MGEKLDDEEIGVLAMLASVEGRRVQIHYPRNQDALTRLDAYGLATAYDTRDGDFFGKVTPAGMQFWNSYTSVKAGERSDA